MGIRRSDRPLVQVLVVSFLGLFGLLGAACTRAPTGSDLAPDTVARAVGWQLLPVDTLKSQLHAPAGLDVILPELPNAVQVPWQEPALPALGLVIQDSAPVWTDSEAGGVLTRVYRGEQVVVLRKEPWKLSRVGTVRMYEISDQFGNRGWIQNRDIMLPVVAIGTGSFGTHEVIAVRSQHSPPFTEPRGIGQPYTLPLIVWESSAFVVVPDLLLGSEPRGDLDFRLRVGYEQNGTFGTPELAVIIDVHGGGSGRIVSFGIHDFRAGSPRLRSGFARRIEGVVTDMSLPQVVFQPPSWEGNLELGRAVVFEYASVSENGVSVTRSYLYSDGLAGDYLHRETRSISNGGWTINTVAGAALRRGPSQGAGLVQRIEAGSLVRAVRISVPSSTVAGRLGSWVQVSTAAEASETSGWIWGDFLRWD